MYRKAGLFLSARLRVALQTAAGCCLRCVTGACRWLISGNCCPGRFSTKARSFQGGSMSFRPMPKRNGVPAQHAVLLSATSFSAHSWKRWRSRSFCLLALHLRIMPASQLLSMRCTGAIGWHLSMTPRRASNWAGRTASDSHAVHDRPDRGVLRGDLHTGGATDRFTHADPRRWQAMGE